MSELARLRSGMSNSQIKKANAISHNEAYLESKKPKPPKAISIDAKLKAQTLMAIAPILAASVSQRN